MIDMKKLWDYLDVQALNIPVPKSHQNSSVNIFCNDCFKVRGIQLGWDIVLIGFIILLSNRR